MVSRYGHYVIQRHFTAVILKFIWEKREKQQKETKDPA